MNNKLKSLYSLADESYDLVVDTCCDHGKLGMAFLNNFPVLFVDQVPNIMKKLQNTLELGPFENYSLVTSRAQDLELAPNKNLICIAGIGGVELISIMDSLIKRCDLTKSHFLLSPQYHLYEVRRFLIDNGFKRIKEELAFDGRRGRELFYVSFDSGEEIDPIGENLFNPEDELNHNYFKEIYEHLRKKAPGSKEAKQYLSLLKSANLAL
jgi:tRNA (adenine22-N1)-methyltransferase